MKSRDRWVLLLGFTLCMCVSPSSLAGPILVDGFESINGASFSGGFMIGFDFRANADGTVTSLGFWDDNSDGLSAAFNVGLWETNTATLLGAVSIDSTDALDTSLTVSGGQWRYESLFNTANVTAGTSYTLAWHTGPLDMLVNEALALNNIGVLGALAEFDPIVTRGSYRFQRTPDFLMPANLPVFPPGTFPGNANAIIEARVIPTPASLALIALGLACLGWTQRVS